MSKLEVSFSWYDWFIGGYYDPDAHALFFTLIPFVVFGIYFDRSK